jgi:uncharacterized repeat protein (TIGR04076 family)
LILLKQLKIKVISKTGKCPHAVGDSWETPYSLKKPKGLCSDAHYVLIPYLGMVSCGASSWEEDGRWKIHCPSQSGVVFELSQAVTDHKWPDDFSWAEEGE